MLAAHEPWPAVVMDRHWNLLRTDRAAERCFGWLLAGQDPPQPPNVIRLMFDPAGLRRSWPTGRRWRSRSSSACTARRWAASRPGDARAAGGGARRARRPGELAPARPRHPTPARGPGALARDGLELGYFSTVTTLGTPQDALLQEIRLGGCCSGGRGPRLPHLVTSQDTPGCRGGRGGSSMVPACTRQRERLRRWTRPSERSARRRAAAAGPRCCGACCAGAQPARPGDP